jgi:glycosyltransferase involved in cell wall biosynthesis
VVPADYEELSRKGVDRMILDRDEGGFFERVVTVHPLASRTRTIDLGPVHRIYEFSLGRKPSRRGLGIVTLAVAPIRLTGVLLAMIRIARNERVNLVRATDPYLMGLLGWVVSRSLGIPFCVSLHADYDTRFRLTPRRGAAGWLRRLARRLPMFVIPRADMVLPIREHMVASLTTAGAARDAIRVIPHGIDMTPFSGSPDPLDRARLGIPERARVISFVGRMSDDNYAADMAAAIERVARRRKDVVFVLVGEGPREGELRARLLGRAELAASVRMLPFQPYERVVSLRRLSVAALCLMGGFSLIEACAAGCPVVAYDVEWHRELVQTGVTGYLVAEGDVDALVAALEELIDDPERAAAMGQAARRAALDRHDIRRTSKIKQECYTELLERHPA